MNTDSSKSFQLFVDQSFQITFWEGNCAKWLLPDCKGQINNLSDFIPSLRYPFMKLIGEIALSERKQILRYFPLKTTDVSFPGVNINVEKFIDDQTQQVHFEITIRFIEKSDADRIRESQGSVFQEIERYRNQIDRISEALDLQRKNQDEFSNEHKKLTVQDKLLQKNRTYLEALMNNSLQGSLLVDELLTVVAANEKASTIFEELFQKSVSKNEVITNYFKDSPFDQIVENLRSIIRGKTDHFFDKINLLVNRTAEYKTFEVQLKLVGVTSNQGRYVAVTIKDISKQEQNKTINTLNRKLLNIGMNENINIFHLSKVFAEGLEKIYPDVTCSVMCLENNKFSSLYTDSLPTAYMQELEGMKFHRNLGSCGRAAIEKRSVTTHDILNDNDWATVKKITKENNLLSCTSVPVLDKSKEPVAVLAFYRNRPYTPSSEELQVLEGFAQLLGVIIEKKNNEKELYKSLELFEYVNKATSDAIYEFDIKKGLIYWGASYSNIFGYPASFDHGAPIQEWFDKIHPGFIDQVKRKWQHFIQSEEKKWNISYRYLKNDNTYADVIENGFLIRDQYGKPSKMIGVLRDVTEQKIVESLLDRSSQLAKIGSWKLDLIHEKIYWSKTTRAIHEVPTQFEPTFDTALDFFQADGEKEKVEAIFNNAIDLNNGFEIDLQLHTFNNAVKYVRLMGEVDIIDGTPSQVYGSIQDITAQKQTELQLAAKTGFLSTLSQINRLLIKYDDWEDVVYQSFELVGKTLDLDRVYFLKYNSEESFFEDSFEWCSSRAFSQKNPSSQVHLKRSDTPSLYDSLIHGDRFESTGRVKITDVGYYMNRKSARSIYFIPIQFKGALFGALGFDDCLRARKWKKDAKDFLDTFADNLSIAFESYRADLKAKHAHEKREELLNSIQDGFFSLNQNREITYWNYSAERITGFSQEAALDALLWDLFPEIDPTLKKKFEEGLNSSASTTLEGFFPLLGKWFEFIIYPTDVKSSVFFKDITKRKKYEKEIIDSRQRLEKVMDSTNDAIWELNINTNIISWGTGYQKLFGYHLKNNETSYEDWKSQIADDDRKSTVDSLLQTLEDESKDSWSAEYHFLRSDGEYAFILDRAYIIRNKSGDPERIIGAKTDITYRKEHEESLLYLNKILSNRAEELHRNNQELEQFAHVASHDLQEPLRMITGFLSQLDKKYSDQLDDKAQKYIDFAFSGAQRMRRSIVDLLEYSKIGKEDLQHQNIDLNSILDEIKATLAQFTDENNAQIIYEDLPTVYSVRTPLIQVFYNLITNGIKYRKPNVAPVIKIRSEETAESFIIAVEDNGIGISKDYHDKIFMIFQRLHGRDEYSGTGVGLAIVKKSIEQIGGEIWLESKEDQGSTFYIQLSKPQQFNTD